MRRRAGYTLIELLIVIGIIGVLMGLIFPVLGSVKESGRRTKCMSNLRQLGLAIEMYSQDEDDYYAVPLYLGNLFPGYISDARIFVCPSDNGVYNNTHPGSNGTLSWEQMQGIPSGTSFCYYPLVRYPSVPRESEWIRWPKIYGYKFATIPVAACHIHHLNAHERDAPIYILTRSTNIAKADSWYLVRQGPSKWR